MAVSLLKSILKHPANRQSRLKAVLFATYWQVYKRLTGQALDIAYHGYRLRCYPHSHSASRVIYYSQLPDYWEMSFICDYLREGDNFIDCGANIGSYSLLARSKIGSQGHVDAFEPNQSTADLLRENVKLNQLNNITVHQCGVAESAAQINLVLTGDDCTSYIDANKKQNQQTVDSNHIQVVRLDEYLDDKIYAMAKFDIEGYEPFAIRGAKKWLENANPPVMLVELAGYSKRHGISTSDFVDELKKQGYFTAIYCPESKAIIRTDEHWKTGADNVLAIAERHQDSVSQRLLGSL